VAARVPGVAGRARGWCIITAAADPETTPDEGDAALACPTCHRVDTVQSVHALAQAGTSVGASGQTQTALAQQLAFDRKPTLRGQRLRKTAGEVRRRADSDDACCAYAA